jgi:hypothetical protein
MGFDANIWGQFAPRVRSVGDYQNEIQRGRANALALESEQMAMDEKRNALAQDAALSKAYAESGGDLNKLKPLLAGGGHYKAGLALDKHQADQKLTGAKTASEEAQTTERKASAEVKYLEAARNKAVEMARLIGSIDPNDNAALGGAWEAAVEAKYITKEQALQFAERAGAAGTPARAKFVAEQRALGLSEVQKRENELKLMQQFEQQRAALEREKTARGQLGVSQGQLGVAQGNLSLSRQRLATDQAGASANKPPVGYRWKPDGTQEPVPGGPADPANRKPVNMSPTMQKEVFEADDTVQSGRAVINILTQAKDLNDKAYSGWGAKGRAVITSNLGGSESADATINLDNMMTGQALESLKLVFGGMPTEGERKILLEMQASADKTPGQRKDIIDRAIKAAQTRVAFNEKKGKALRDGTYMTQGVENSPVQDTTPKVVNWGDLK